MRWIIFLICIALTACGAPTIDYRGKNAVSFEQPLRKPLSRPLIAVALGSGGPRGLTHIGVLKALEANGIVPDLIVGTSSGALVGSIYASGLPLAQMESMAMALQPKDFFDFSYSDRGWIRGEKLQQFINRLVNNKPLEQLQKEIAIVSTDLKTGTAVVFNRGDTGLAVRASSAIPGRIQPVKINGRDYLDGDLVSPVPMRNARELGADVVIGVDVSAYLEDTPTTKTFPTDWIVSGTMRKTIVDHETRFADVLIHPNIGYFAGWSDQYKRLCFARGERDTLAAIPKIKAAIAAAQQRIDRR